MKPSRFKYFAPESIQETAALIAEHGYDAKLLAGGQSLIPAMNFRLVQPAIIVDLSRVPDLSYIKPNGRLSIGAMTTQATLERSPLITKHNPLLAETMPFIAHPQIRNRGTIGGSMVHADPAAELPLIAMTLNATFHIQNDSSTRSVPANEFFLGMFETILEPEELLTHIEFPQWNKQNGYSFIEVARRHGDYALVGVACTLSLDENNHCTAAKLVYLNVGDRPMDAIEAASSLIGQPVNASQIDQAAEIAATTEIDPMNNIHASIQYQRHLTRVLTKRAIQTAVARAQGV